MNLRQLRPSMIEWDESCFFPRDQLRKCAQLGFGGLYVSSENGGSGLSRLETSVIIEALSQGCVSTTAFLSIHNMATAMLDKFGSAPLQERFLERLINFELMASYCLTEPSSGSDAASLLTTATKKEGFYVCKFGLLLEVVFPSLID